MTERGVSPAPDEGRGEDMRYEDTSGSVSGSATPGAHDDADTLATGSNGPATGNVITGAGTTTGKAGADSPLDGHVVAVRGASGSDSSDSGQSLHVDGRFGTLVIDEHGGYKYVADGHAPQNFRDLFQYTLADSKGDRSVADLVISRGGEIQVSENAQKIVPNPDGTVTLPAGVDLNDVHVVGRDLVVTMPDGSQIVVVDGAVFVPQLVLGGVEVPSTNLAALLIDAEPKPAAGNPQSSGGNFEVPVGPLDPGVPLGDLIPPTELHFTPPEFQPVFPGVEDREPTITIQPDGQPASAAAEDSVDEKGLPTRNGGEPAGSGEIADGNGSNNSDGSETTTGTIIINSPDGISGITINGVAVTGAVGQVISGDFGTLTITGFNGQNILYSYTLADNTSGDNTHDNFSVTITDPDGDHATATLTIDIIDDVPTARPDTDAIAAGQFGPETGNVLTGAGTTSGTAGADTPGADGAHLSNVTGAGATTAGEGSWTVVGQYGVLTINDDGSYSYTRNAGTPGGVSDVFNYTLTDGDGDQSTTTLTISIGDLPTSLNVPTGEDAGTQVSEVGLPTRNGGEPAGSGEIADGNGSNNSDPSERTDGTITFNPGDGPATVTINGTAVTGAGQTFAGAFGTLTIDSYNANGTITYHYVLADNTSGNNTHDDFNVVVTDQDGDHSDGTLTINIVDDVPTAHNDTDALAAGSYGPETGNVISGAGTTSGAAGADVVGADNAQVSAVTGFNGSADSTVDGSGNLVVNGQYGVLTINQDGSYSYARNAGTPGGVSDTFNYTLTDGDGDQSNATLTITIGDAPTSLNIPTGEDAGTLVHEAGLPTRNGGEPAGSGEIADGNGANNSDPSERTDGTITFNPGDGPATVTINGTAVTGAGQNISGSFGTLTIDSYDANGTITYHYVLGDNTSGDTTHDDFNVVVTDQDGDHSNGTLTINIVDDVPTAHNDTDSMATGSFGPETGNVITGAGTTSGAAGADVVGADNANVSAISSVNVPANSDGTADGSGNFVVHGQYGTLTINEDGSYSYTRDAGTPGGVSDVFNYQLTDGDGDHSNATLTINIGDATPHTDPNPAVGLDDDALANGNPGGVGDDPNSVNTTGQLSGSGGDGALTFAVQTTGAPSGFSYVSGGAGIVLVQQGGNTVLTVTVGSDGSYSVVQNAPIDHAAGGDENNAGFTINYTVTDSDGDSAPGTLNISVDDDTPLANNDTDVTDPATDTAVGNVITGVGTVEGAANADHPGADGFGSISGLSGFNGSTDTNPTGGFSVNGQYGTLQMDADGNYTYTRNPGTPGGATDTFTYTYVDGDGDPVSATLTVTIADHVPVAGNVNVGLDDDALAGGNPGGVGDDPNSVNASGTLPGTGGDAPLSFSVQTTGAPSGFTYVSGGAGIVLVQQGGTTVLTVTVGSDGSYSVVQNNPIMHAAGGDENNANFTVNYTVTDSDGDTAPGTISISVDDDTPIAHADIDNVAAGTYGPETGNVITGAGTVGGLGGAGADSAGADGNGHITGLVSVNVPANSDNNAAGGFVVHGQYGQLAMQADGSYSYTRDAGTPGGVSDTFTYSFTDGDGDTTTTTLTINIADATPVVGSNLTVGLDDDALAGGNPGGVGDDPNSVNATGTLSGSGGDGPLAFSVQTTGAPAGFSYVSGGAGVVLVQQGGVTVLTVTVGSDGHYSVVQNNPINHAAGGDENNANFTINYQVTDQDGDSAPGTLNISVDDDTPTVVLSGTSPSLTVDESNLTVNDTKPFAGMFTDSFGADGPAAANSVGYTLGLNAGSTGLVDVATGQAIVLVNNAGVIEGHVGSAAGLLAFSVSVDSSGNVTLDQVRALSHPDAANPNDSVTLANDNLITLTQTITDHDGDQASATANIGQNLNFLDDGPTIGLAGGTEPSLTVDETILANNDTVSFAGAFTSSFGADGAGTVGYALAITGGNGTLSGLKDTATGQNIVLVQNGSVVEGHVGTNAGALAFTVTVDGSGNVTLDQIRAVVHSNTADPNDNATLSADNLITLTATVTDKDGDHTSSTLNIGQNLNFHDDGPTLGTVQSQQTDNNPATAPAVGTLHFTPGADGAGSAMTITADFTGITSGGHAIVMHQVGNVLTGYQDVGPAGYDAGDTTAVFTLTVNPTAGTSGQYVFDLITPLDPQVTNVDIGGSTSFGAGPTQSQTLNDGGSQNLSVVSGYLTGAGFNEATWLSTGTASGLTLSSVNGSTAGWGVANNNFEGTNEFFNWDFGSGALDTQGGVFTPPGGVSMPQISFATYDFINYSAADDVSYVVHYTDGTFTSGHVPSANMAAGGPNWTFTAASGKFIADIEMYSSGTAPGKVDLVSVGVQSSNFDKTPSFTVQLTDGDGDPTSTGAFTIHIKDGLSPSSPAAQMALVQKTAPTQTATNSNSVLMGALAAAGLAASDSVAAATPHTDLHSSVSHMATAAYHSQSIGPMAIQGLEGHQSVSMLARGGDESSAHAAAQSTAFHNTDMVAAKGIAAANTGHDAAPSQVQHGTSVPVHAEPAASSVTAASIVMPAAQQLAAAAHGGATGQHNPALGQVLAEALQGGGNSSTIDHVLSQLPSHAGGGNPALEALASHNAAGVSMGDSHAFAGFTTGHVALSMEAVMVHIDAVQPHA